jgi:hypothetical protein
LRECTGLWGVVYVKQSDSGPVSSPFKYRWACSITSK